MDANRVHVACYPVIHPQEQNNATPFAEEGPSLVHKTREKTGEVTPSLGSICERKTSAGRTRPPTLSPEQLCVSTLATLTEILEPGDRKQQQQHAFLQEVLRIEPR